jgi:tetratricopeptide (TPR) repeat protein
MMIKNGILGSIFTLVILFSFCKNEKKVATAPPTSGEINKNIAELTELINKNPKNDSLFYLRAQAYYMDDSYDNAIYDASMALELDSMKAPYYHLLADVFLDYYKSHEALRIMETAAGRFPKRIPTLLKLSEYQLILKQHSEALGSIDRIFKQDPQNAEAWFMTGQVCKDMGQIDRAVKSYKKAVAIDPQNIDSYICLGQLFTTKKDATALLYFDNALRIDSTNLETRHAIADYYSQTGNLKKAISSYRDIIKLDGTYADAYFNIGLLFMDMDSLEKAKSNFDITIKTDPMFVKAFYFRGIAKEKLGDKTAAYEDFDLAARMAPGYKEAEDAAKRLKK